MAFGINLLVYKDGREEFYGSMQYHPVSLDDICDVWTESCVQNNSITIIRANCTMELLRIAAVLTVDLNYVRGAKKPCLEKSKVFFGSPHPPIRCLGILLPRLEVCRYEA